MGSAWAAAVCLVLAAGACTSAPVDADSTTTEPLVTPPAEAAAAEEPLESSLVWEPCDAPFECSTLSVPVDHAQPGGPHVDLALVRLPAPPAARRIGSLVVNPGGPGGSGVQFVRHAAIETIPAELRARFDIVGFDPRGVAGSAGIDCGQGPIERFGAALAGGVSGALDAARDLAASCAEQAGPLLHHMASHNVAADLDLIREALGDRRLTYLGYSYGTFIGALYAERYPEQVRALVLDGALDPAQDVVAQARDKAATTRASLEAFLDWCDHDHQCLIGSLDGTPAEVFADALAALSAGPVPAPQLDGGRALSKGVALLTMSVLLQDKKHGWPALALGVALVAVEHDGSALLAMFDALHGHDTEPEEIAGFDLGQLMAVNCLDWPAPPPEEYPQLVREVEEISPEFGAVTLYAWAPCSYWPAPPVRSPAPISAPGSPPLVVIGTRGDIVTPYRWAEALAGQLDHAVLFTRDGHSHTAFGGGNRCTDLSIMRYLLDEEPPEHGQSCG